MMSYLFMLISIFRYEFTQFNQLAISIGTYEQKGEAGHMSHFIDKEMLDFLPCELSSEQYITWTTLLGHIEATVISK